MPKINQTAEEQSLTPIPTAVESTVQTIVNTTTPILICGVNRKVNIGNFENIDVYSAITLPLGVDPADIESLKAAIVEAAELGFSLTSQETGLRYSAIKDMQKSGRPGK